VKYINKPVEAMSIKGSSKGFLLPHRLSTRSDRYPKVSAAYPMAGPTRSMVRVWKNMVTPSCWRYSIPTTLMAPINIYRGTGEEKGRGRKRRCYWLYSVKNFIAG